MKIKKGIKTSNMTGNNEKKKLLEKELEKKNKMLKEANKKMDALKVNKLEKQEFENKEKES